MVDFKSDLKQGKHFENLVKLYLCGYDISNLKHISGVSNGYSVIDFFYKGIPYEVKSDFRANTTGNCYIELKSNKGISGLAKTYKAHPDCILAYVVFLSLEPTHKSYEIHFMKLEDVMPIAEKCNLAPQKRDVNSTAYGALIKIEDLKKHGVIYESRVINIMNPCQPG